MPATVIPPIEQAEAFVAKTGAPITHGGSRAFYRPSTDSIQLPPREAFIGSPTSTAAEAYYSTLLHELTHYTSHESRCNRQLGKRFGDARLCDGRACRVIWTVCAAMKATVFGMLRRSEKRARTMRSLVPRLREGVARLGVPGMGTGLEVKVLCGARW